MNRKPRLQATRAWLQGLSSNPSLLEALLIPHSTSNSPKASVMMSIPMSQSPEDQFLHWCQNMERKQEEQARQMKELQGQEECLRCENDYLRAYIEKSHKNAQDNGCDVQSIARNRGKGPIVPDDVNTPADGEPSSGSSPSLNLSLEKNTWESTRTRSRKRPSPHPSFSDAISGASCRERREAGKRQYQPGQASGNLPVLPSSTLPLMPPTHPTFGIALTFYVSLVALI